MSILVSTTTQWDGSFQKKYAENIICWKLK